MKLKQKQVAAGAGKGGEGGGGGGEGEGEDEEDLVKKAEDDFWAALAQVSLGLLCVYLLFIMVHLIGTKRYRSKGEEATRSSTT